TSYDSSYLLDTARFWTRGQHSYGNHRLGLRAIVLSHSSHTASSHRLYATSVFMWHRPDRVLRQFGMDQPLPTFDMPRSEVMINLETTQRGTRQADWVARYPRYLRFWEQRFDHEAAG
ncbi:hypothetical protein LINPERHAP1_LOCUS4200, partial [Linum perenne]